VTVAGNKAAAPNRRPHFAFAMLCKFDYYFYAPPSLSAAVGEPQRFSVSIVETRCQTPYD
jgi:hypothetical protein